jgi:hypothetical protein
MENRNYRKDRAVVANNSRLKESLLNSRGKREIFRIMKLF